MIIVSVLGIFTQTIHGMVLITYGQRFAKSPFRIDFVQIIRCLVTLTIFILELIAELQESSPCNRFAISDLRTIIIVIRRSSDILVTNQSRIRIGRNLIVTRHGLRVLVIVIITIAEASAERNITPFVIQFTVNLQRCIGRNTLAVRKRTAVRSIHTNVLQRVSGAYRIKIKIIIWVSNQAERVCIEGSRQ